MRQILVAVFAVSVFAGAVLLDRDFKGKSTSTAGIVLAYFVAAAAGGVLLNLKRVERKRRNLPAPRRRNVPAPRRKNPPPAAKPVSRPEPAPANRSATPKARKPLPVPALGPDGLPDNINDWIVYCYETGTEWSLDTVADLEDIPGWLDQNPEQDTWLLVIEGLNPDLKLSIDVLKHMAGHPDCSQAVAIELLRHCYAVDFFGAEAKGPDGFGDWDCFPIVQTICRRAAGEGFVFADIAYPGPKERERLRESIEAAARQGSPHFPAPLNLLSQPAGERQLRVPYFVDETGISRLSLEP